MMPWLAKRSTRFGQKTAGSMRVMLRMEGKDAFNPLMLRVEHGTLRAWILAACVNASKAKSLFSVIASLRHAILHIFMLSRYDSLTTSKYLRRLTTRYFMDFAGATHPKDTISLYGKSFAMSLSSSMVFSSSALIILSR